jgi:5-methylcytosine-specific restriction endonuclease McrA
METKVCVVCFQSKDIASFDEYHRSHDGYRSTCNVCRITGRQIEEYPLKKVCTRCNKIKPTEDFNKCNSSRDGLDPRCRHCRKSISKKYHDTLSEQYNNDVERRKSVYTHGIHYARAAVANRSKNGVITPREVQDLFERSGGVCLYCNRTVGDDYHLDHIIPLDRGGLNNIENCAISCRSCNMAKDNMLISEFCEWIELIHKRLKYIQDIA